MNSKLKYKDFCHNRNDIPLFHQPWWLDAVTSGNWDVAISVNGNGEICAAMPYTQTKKYFRLAALQPFLTPYLGVLFFYPPDMQKRVSFYSFENEHSKKVIEQLPDYLLYQRHAFSIDFKNWFPFYFKGFTQSSRYTYILKYIKDQEQVRKGMTNNLKRQISNAQENCSIHETDNIHHVFDLTKETLSYKNVKYAMKNEVLEKLDHELSLRGQRKILIAKNKEGIILSGLYLCWDSRQAYLLGLGMKRNYRSTNSVKLVIWQSIRIASEFVDEYNFEGSMVPEVETVFRSFGGEMTPYFEIRKYKNRLIRVLLGLFNY